MALIRREFNLCVVPSKHPPMIDLSQYDNGVELLAHFVDESGTPYDIPADAEVTVEGINRDNIPFRFNADDVTTRTVLFTPRDAMTSCYGQQRITLTIISSGKQFSPLAIVLNIQKSGLSEDEVVKSSKFESELDKAFGRYLANRWKKKENVIDLSDVKWEVGTLNRNGKNYDATSSDSVPLHSVRTKGFISVPANTLIKCSDFDLCDAGMRVAQYEEATTAINAIELSSYLKRDIRVMRDCYIRIVLKSDTRQFDTPIVGGEYDGQMMTSIAPELVSVVAPGVEAIPESPYTLRTGIPRTILPNDGYILQSTTSEDASLPVSNSLNYIYGKWNALMAAHPGYITRETIGHSEKHPNDSSGSLDPDLPDSDVGYPIYCYRIKNYIETPENQNYNPDSQFKFCGAAGPQKNLQFIWIGAIHGHEQTIPVDDFKFFSELVKREDPVMDSLMANCDFWVIPVANPYGYNEPGKVAPTGARIGRVNARGVNLNRNFPEAFMLTPTTITVDGEIVGNPDYSGPEAASESETQAIMQFLTAHPDAFMVINRHTKGNFAPTSVLAYLASIIEVDRKLAFNTARFCSEVMRKSDLYTSYMTAPAGSGQNGDNDPQGEGQDECDGDGMQPVNFKPSDVESRCLYSSQVTETSGTMDKYYNAQLGLDGYLLEMSYQEYKFSNTPWGGSTSAQRQIWQRINVSGIANILYSLMLQNEYIQRG